MRIRANKNKYIHHSITLFSFFYSRDLKRSNSGILEPTEQEELLNDTSGWGPEAGRASLWFKTSIENSQDYSQKPQWNCTFMNLASVLPGLTYLTASVMVFIMESILYEFGKYTVFVGEKSS